MNTISCCKQDKKPLRIAFSQQKAMVVCLDLDEVRRTRNRVQYRIKYNETVTTSEYPNINTLSVGTIKGIIRQKDLREPQTELGLSFCHDRSNNSIINKVQTLKHNTNLLVSESVGCKHKICLHDMRHLRRPVLEYINRSSPYTQRNTAFYIDDNEDFLLADAKIKRNTSFDHLIRVYDVKRGVEVAAYPQFAQLFYEEAWPMLGNQPGFLGIRSGEKPVIQWLSMSKTMLWQQQEQQPQ